MLSQALLPPGAVGMGYQFQGSEQVYPCCSKHFFHLGGGLLLRVVELLVWLAQCVSASIVSPPLVEVDR